MDTSTYTYEYLPARGISKETLAFYDVKTKINSEGVPVSTGFRYPNDSYKIRYLKSKEFSTLGEISKAGLYGRDKFSAGTHKYVTITEGEYDALSLYQVLRSPVVSVQSAVVAGRDCAVDYEWLQSFDRIYIAFDNDEHGRKAARDVARLFDYNKVYIVKFTKRKDANEYLEHGEAEDLRNIWWNSKRYLPEGIISTLSEFSEILKQRPAKGVYAYPSIALNEMTYGIRKGESVLITAMEGVGKTELMHSIEFNLLKGTDDAVGAIYLEEPKHRHLQALAGLELRLPVHLPDASCSDAEVSAALTRIVKTDDRLHVYSHFGSDDPDVILDTIRFLATARSCSYVLLDHIGMVVSGLAGDDERRALDYLATRLEMMVKELNFALIMVSHVNDEGKTRGSRMISKICDIRIHADRDLLNASESERNITKLSVPKNRFSGLTGPAGVLVFDPATYTYRELSPVNDNNKEQYANVA